ncbi:MAG: TetR/AcrR family transcriptional regulator [Bacilli bacterium]|nr:TetR/AcrR family transcriptional regulator [Bacilli bacterium]
MKYNNESRTAKSNENKDKIIEVALKLINEKGFDNVSVSEITKEAGVSKGAFYIHFESKEDLIEKQISMYFDDSKLEGDYSKYEKLEYFLITSIKRIKKSGLKMCQVWFSHGVLGGFHGKTKLAYDLAYVKELYNEEIAKEIVSIYYGALNLWCFTDGAIEVEEIVLNYINKYKEK